jgi:Tol biopolymer transport system component
MGEVYRARDSRLGREVALKVVAAELVGDELAGARFDREWRAVARLSHPNVVALYDIGQHEDLTFAVMELVSGGTLRQRLAAGPLSAQKAVEVGVQIARGLAAAHEAGIVHRDLKPENVSITPSGHVKILDFGLAGGTPLARTAAAGGIDTASLALTGKGVVLGTRSYMAPEQVRGEPVDQRTDIFAFGAVLYEMLTGHRAFMGSSAIETLHAIVAGEPDLSPLSSTHPSVRRIAIRCLEKRPDDRFTSAHDLGYALEAAAEGLSGTGAVPLLGSRPVWVRWAGLVIVAAALLLAGFAIDQLWRTPASSRAAGQGPPPIRAQIEGPPGVLGEMGVSPDGTMLAAIAYSRSESILWVRAAGGTGWRRLAALNMRDAAWFAWSPDSRSVCFPALVDQTTQLQIADLASGVVRSVELQPVRTGTATNERDPLDMGRVRVGGAWSRTAGILIGGARLRVVSVETGTVSDALAANPSVTSQLWPSFLPDGKTFVFTQNASSGADRGVFLGALGSRQPARLLTAPVNAQVAPSGWLLYPENRALMAARFDFASGRRGAVSRLVAALPSAFGNFSWFALGPGGTLLLPADRRGLMRLGQLQIFSRRGAPSATIGGRDPYIAVNLSRDGRRLAIETGRNALDVIDIDRGLRVPLGITQPGQWLTNPVWSPDGRHVAATRNAGGSEPERNLVTVDASTGQVTVLIKTARARWPQAWSRSGREIVVTLWETYGASLWAVSAKAPHGERRLSPEGVPVARASLSPDDRWVAYDSSESGEYEVYVQPFEGGGERRRVSRRGGIQPLWRDNGRELFYLERDGTLMSVPVSPAMEPGVPVALFPIHPAPEPFLREYAVLPGGDRFIAVVPLATEAPDRVTLLTDWLAPSS